MWELFLPHPVQVTFIARPVSIVCCHTITVADLVSCFDLVNFAIYSIVFFLFEVEWNRVQYY
jgi:hypothetical protein